MLRLPPMLKSSLVWNVLLRSRTTYGVTVSGEPSDGMVKTGGETSLPVAGSRANGPSGFRLLRFSGLRLR